MSPRESHDNYFLTMLPTVLPVSCLFPRVTVVLLSRFAFHCRASTMVFPIVMTPLDPREVNALCINLRHPALSGGVSSHLKQVCSHIGYTPSKPQAFRVSILILPFSHLNFTSPNSHIASRSSSLSPIQNEHWLQILLPMFAGLLLLWPGRLLCSQWSSTASSQ
jgi:hypothetical protein